MTDDAAKLLAEAHERFATRSDGDANCAMRLRDALEASERAARGLAQLLAHVHLHMTNDDGFGADELESDMRKLGAGKFIDTETLLIDLRAKLEASERKANDFEQACRRRDEMMKDDALRLEQAEAHLREVTIQRNESDGVIACRDPELDYADTAHDRAIARHASRQRQEKDRRE